MNGELALDTGGAFATALFKRVMQPALQPGDQLGPYRLEEQIGRGGSALVFRALRCDGVFDQEVAIKVLHRVYASELGKDWNERSLLGRLRHPGIAQILNGGTSESGYPWFAMELVHGTSLRAYFDRRARHWRDRVATLLQVAEAVGFAHSHGVVHGDIKPANVLVETDGRAKLLDFGIGNFQDPGRERTGRPAFTPGYASPEQVIGAEVTPRSDIFQLGLLLKTEVLDSLQRAGEESTGEARYLGDASESVPVARYARLQAICARATREAPSERYEDVLQLRADLSSMLADETALGLASETGAILPAKVRQPHPIRYAMRYVLAISLSVVAVLLVILTQQRPDWVLGPFTAVRPAQAEVDSEHNSPLAEMRRLDRRALESRMGFDGDWMRRVVEVEEIAGSYLQLGMYDRAHRLALASADEAVEDSRATPRERLRLELLKLQTALSVSDGAMLMHGMDIATQLYTQAQLGPDAIEHFEFLRLQLQIAVRAGDEPSVRASEVQVSELLRTTPNIPPLKQAQAWEALALARLARRGFDTDVVAALRSAHDLRARYQSGWDLPRLSDSALLLIVSAPDQAAAAFAEFVSGLKDVETRFGVESDQYLVGKLLLGIVLFETGDEARQPQARVLLDETSEQLADRGIDLLDYLLLAETYRAVLALEEADYARASVAALRASQQSEVALPSGHPLRRLLQTIERTAHCVTDSRNERRAPLPTPGFAPKEADMEPGMFALVEFAIVSECLDVPTALAHSGLDYGHARTLAGTSALTPRLRSLLLERLAANASPPRSSAVR